MAASGETSYSFENPHPDVLVRARDTQVALYCWKDGAQVQPSACDLEVYTPESSDAAATPAVVLGTPSLATVTAATLPSTLSPGAGFQLLWKPTLDGVQHLVDREAWLAVRPLYNPLSINHLEGMYPGITAKLTGSGKTSFDWLVVEVHAEGVVEITQRGLWPHQVKSQWSLLKPYRHMLAAKAFRWMFWRSRDQTMAALAEKHESLAAAAWSEFASALDRDGDGRPDDPEALHAGSTIVHACAAPHTTLQRHRFRPPTPR